MRGTRPASTGIAAPLMLADLVDRALAVTDYRNDRRYWRLVEELQEHGSTHTYGIAIALCASDNPLRRRLGCHLLGRMTWHLDAERDQAVAVLEDRAFCEQDIDVLCASVMSLGELADPSGLHAVMVLAEHRAAPVRVAVACALPALLGVPPHAEGLSVLRALMDDPVPDVRDWATFALGDTEGADDVESRSALLERLDDEDRSVSGEALIALARKGDDRALPSVLDRLRHEDTVDEEVIEAARELGHPHVLALLLDLRDHAAIIGLDQAVLDQAIASCGGHDLRRHPSADHPTRRSVKD